MNTTNDGSVGLWLNTAEGLRQVPRRTPAASVPGSLSATARWNVAVLLGTGLASTVFFLTALTHSRPYAPLANEVRTDVPAQASVTQASPAPLPIADQPRRRPSIASIPIASTIQPPVKSDARIVRTTGPVKPTRQGPLQSRVARLFLGDGSVEVRPFPTLTGR